MDYIIAHDVGTQSNKAILISKDGKIDNAAEYSYDVNLPKSGWVEQSPDDYWQAVCTTTKEITSTLNRDDTIMAMVFSTQAMGIIPVDKKGTVLYNNISWVDSRAGIQAKKIMNRFLGKSVFKKITGVELSGKDVIPKLVWLKENEQEIYNKTYKILDVNGFLKYKCTNKMVAEWSGACSYAFNLKKKNWEFLFFKIAGVAVNMLPELVKSTDLVGNLTETAANELGLPSSVKIFGGCDDTQSAAMGSGQIENNQGHVYLGSSAWIGISTHKNYKFKSGVASLASADPKSTLLVGITESAGINIEWALNMLYKNEKEQGIDVYHLMETEVDVIPAGADQLIFTPWFQGERTPITDTTVRSTIFNLGLEHTRGHIMRALLESIGYNLKWTIENIKKDYGIAISKLTIIGGGSQNESWMQSLSDILQVELHITEQPKTAGAIGCAMTAIVGLGLVDDFSKIKDFNPICKSFKPRNKHIEIYDQMFLDYKTLYKKLKKTYYKTNFKRFNY